MLYFKGFCGKVDKDDLDFTAVVGIDGAGGVEDGDAVFGRQSASGAHLCLVADGQFDEQTCGYHGAFHGVQGNGGLKIGSQVHASTLCGGVCRCGVGGFVDDFADHIFNVLMNETES